MIYVHVPFCRSFCTYCDFFSEICREGDRQAQEGYVRSLMAEISARKDEIEATEAVDTLYVGGGTPSVLPPSFFRTLTATLGKSSYREFTVEVNPEDIVTRGKAYVMELLACGVNRISMGVQSLDDGILKWMNRRHDSARARQAYRLLRESGVKNVSLDVIFGLSHLSLEVLGETLGNIIEMRPEHISAYQLSIEEGSALARMVSSGIYHEASQEQCARQYGYICHALAEAGYVHYEISNWALPGFEARHNSAYWTRRAYVGLGPGAHSFDGRSRRSWNSESLEGWTPESEILSDAEIREEQIMLGLRTAAGISPDLCDPDVLARLESDGSLVPAADGNVRIPEEHFFISDAIIEELI